MRRFGLNFTRNASKRLVMTVSGGITAATMYGVSAMATASPDDTINPNQGLLPPSSSSSSDSDNLQSKIKQALNAAASVTDTSNVTSALTSDSNANNIANTPKYGDMLESAQLHDMPQELETSFFDSEWNDWYENKIELIFTENSTDLNNLNNNNDNGHNIASSVNDGNNIKPRMERLVRATQEHLCYEIIKLEETARAELIANGVISEEDAETKYNKEFERDFWTRDQSRCGVASKYAGGITKVLANSILFEKAGISVSISSGKLPSGAVSKMTANHGKLKTLLKENKLGDKDGNVEYFAASVSSVIHPWNPHAPTGHFNYRYFELGDKKTIIINNENSTNNDNNNSSSEGETVSKDVFVPKLWWFGGGGDLTPSILYKEDCVHFHETFKNVCDRYNKQFYNKFKQWCDNYFVIKHRKNERRGIGGIFFDDLESIDENYNSSDSENSSNENERREKLFEFVKDLASTWHLSYLPIVKRHGLQKYTSQEKEWQQIRRGRYAEFNLVYDRGTKFGLMKPGARHESILMSLPLTANWQYCREPKYEFEKDLYDVIMNPVDWV